MRISDTYTLDLQHNFQLKLKLKEEEKGDGKEYIKRKNYTNKTVKVH